MSKTFKAAKHTLRALSKTLEDIRTQNKNGDKWKAGAETMLEKIQTTYKGVDSYDIQGTKAHKSSKDPTDPKEVITIGFYKGRNRLLSGHLHEDGSYKVQESRAGRGKAKEEAGKGDSSKRSSSSASASRPPSSGKGSQK